jgi:hypothetical protein
MKSARLIIKAKKVRYVGRAEQGREREETKQKQI